MRRILVTAGLVLAGLSVVWIVFPWAGPDAALGQPSRTKSGARRPAANVQAIDQRAQRTVDGFVRETLGLAREYEEAGHFEKAKQLYEAVLNVNPDTPGVRDKIKDADEAILSGNESELELDAGSGWGTTRVRVFKGRPLRLQASGTYRFVTDVNLGPEGFPTAEPTRDHMADNVPCGALMAALVNHENKIGKPFAIGAGMDYTPNEDGWLHFRLNVPPGSRCTGKIQIRLSGYVLSN